MIRGIREAERLKQVRDAAKAWCNAGFVDAGQNERIATLYADDRVRLGPGFAVLAFLFTGIAVSTTLGFADLFFSIRGDAGNASLFFTFAIVSALLTELQRGPFRRLHTGSDDATALLSALFGVIGSCIMVEGPWVARTFFGTAFIFCGLGAWRWGDALLAFSSTVGIFGFLAQDPDARMCWIVVGLLAAPVAIAGSRSPRFAPSRRTGLEGVAVLSLFAVYVAVHVYTRDHGWLEGLRPPPGGGNLRTASILATALMPPMVLSIGLRKREPILLYCGLLMLAFSIATIKLYYDLMPVWAAFLLGGVSCLTVAVLLRRWLRNGPGGERFGFTADGLFESKSRTDAIRAVVAMASFTPEARAPESPSAFKGGGGGFGGGGATGNF